MSQGIPNRALAFSVLVIVATIALVVLGDGPSREGFLSNAFEGWMVRPQRQRILEEPVGVLVVNLDRRVDRMEAFSTHYSRADIVHQFPLHRMSAVEGKKVDWKLVLTPEARRDMEDFLRTKTRKTHEQLTPGAIGCYLSHVKAWEWVMKKNQPWIICEDDAALPRDFYSRVKKALATVPASDKNTIILFHVICSSPHYEELKCDYLGENVYRAHKFWSTACYYITPEAARKMHATSIPIEIQVDAAMALWARSKVVDIFAFPCVNTMDEAGTDIQYPVRDS